VSWEEYKAMVLEANPNGSLRYTSPTAKNIGRGGSAKTFIGDPDPRMAAGYGSNAAAVRNAEITRDASLGYFDNVTQRALNDLGSKNKATDEAAKQTLTKLAESGNLTKQQTTQIANRLQQEADRSNSESSASTQRLTRAVNTTNTSNTSALRSYESGIQPYQREIAGTTRQNVQFDPEGLSAQRASLAQAAGIAGGSLDYQSQAARAYANPADVQRALEGIEMLRQNATDGGKEQLKNLQIARDEYEHGGDDQREVMERYKAISNPEMTAAERAILDQSQRQYAIHDKANRDAVSQDLEARGMMSGAGQIAAQQAAQQRLGEERTAGMLGAQAQAVQRALIGMQGWKDTATDLRTGNQNAEQLMQAAANALREGDLQAANAFTVAAQRQREQGFNEEYSRGVAADNASANNQSTRLGGAQLQGQQANAIRSANDAVNMFNNEQQGITDRYNTSFKQSEYDRLAGLQQSTLNNRLGVNQTNLGNETMLDDSTQRAIGDRFGRTNTAAQTGIGVAMGNWGIDQGIAGAELDEQRASQRRAESEVGTRIGTAGQRVGLSRQTDDDVRRALMGL
jgi:polyhydroxyalkanoate synthesis regulator phasin